MSFVHQSRGVYGFGNNRRVALIK